ncbi:unnamed protein product [Meloidogyne enterolobii]|uniref:Uncharacterized protein n=1 Tax=Meloidogyne enterolobii TaxID=390850 RepID=A0ACB0Z421_MELEN
MDATNGLNYLHENHILHCDLAARNCLLNRDLQIKISDFGTSRLLPKGQDFVNTTKGEKLAYKYLAPETIHKKILSKKRMCGVLEFYALRFLR